ncbi:penicillin-binding protein 2 [Rhodococcus sp. X156]|uniref:peptidoglycan D,D-transpeptidase FtsI family protein n=1 Tax=Rhodococcus sp. X156 TaxID=2499145 RepID=UPI001F49487D|nr:penicillin-binding protein 2 [Rhodococcus sp. X156]
MLMVAALVIAGFQLIRVQGVDAAGLSARADAQRTSTQTLVANRGAITDVTGKKMAFTLQAKALTFQPQAVKADLVKAREANPAAPTPADRIQQIAVGVHDVLGPAAPVAKLVQAMSADTTFTYLARGVDPALATQITESFPEVGAERQDIRQYPTGRTGANMIGGTGWDGHGLLGLEGSMDATLAGTDGTRTVEVGSDGAVIPGSTRDEQPAQDGDTIQLTFDADAQYQVQEMTQRAKDLSGAKHASVVVMDTKGKIVAMANDGTFDPGTETGTAPAAALGNPSVTTPFEPGSVAKIVTAAAAIEYGVTTPEEVLDIPAGITMGGATVRDAWGHGDVKYTTTGVFGKSSNIGTLVLAQRVGADRFSDMVSRFGLGQLTNVGLPGETAGSVPPQSQWSGSTFANLPIGQGLSMSLLQMTGMYQAIANGGVRIPPRVVAATVDASGNRTETPEPEGVRVVSEQTASTVKDMFRAVVQDEPNQERGTGVAAGIDGYQVSGKTGTAQQVDPKCGCYSNSQYNITFAGMVPADNPKYVIGIMLDAPERSTDGKPGASAAPLFHDIASWLLLRNRVPLSSGPTPVMPFVKE